MFTQRIRRTGSSVGKSLVIKSTAVFGAVGILGALAVAAPAVASDTTTHGSWAQGQFLSGTLVGLDLDTIVGLKPATVSNNGTQGTKEVVDPLAVNLLGTTALNVGAVRVSPDAVLSSTTTGGVLSQYAMASNTGGTLGASGSIGEGGAVGPNASHPNSALTLHLDQLIGTKFNAVISDLDLSLRAIAANAHGTLQTVDGDYYIDGLTLSFTSPALAGVSTAVTKAVAAAEAKLDALTSANGELAVALKAILVAANPALNVVGGANISIKLQHDLRAVVAELLTKTWGGSGVSFNVTTGKVIVDLNALVGGSLNNRPVNSELLTSATVNLMVSTISTNVSNLTAQVLARVDAAVANLKLDVDVDVAVLTDQAPITGQSCQYEDKDGNILSELLGKLLGTLVCTPTTTLLPKLKTSVTVDVHGTVSQVLNGSAPATAVAQVLGVPVAISTGRILSGLSGILNSRIYSAGGILPVLHSSCDGPLLAQANAGLLGSAGIQGLLSGVLSLKVNLQDTNLGTGWGTVVNNTVFNQTALRVSVAPSLGVSGLTTLSLASASVAPSTTLTTTGDPGNPGDPGTYGLPGTDNPGDPGTPGATGGDIDGATPAASGSGSLAYTGVAIGSAIAAMLALLIAGAWLARKGYRRNHPTLEL